MKVLSSFVVVGLSMTISLGASAASYKYSCHGKNSYGEKVSAELEVASAKTVKFNGERAKFDADYQPHSRKDMARFLFVNGPQTSDLVSVGVLVSNDLLDGSEKGFLTQEWTGEGYQADHYACFLQ